MKPKYTITTNEKLTLPVSTTIDDKLNGKKCDPHHCMYKVSVSRALHELFPEENNHHRVRVDGGHIKFVHGGYRWEANTPPRVRSNLQKFDASLRCKECKRNEFGFCDRHNTQPHEWKCVAMRRSKIRVESLTPKRKKQINAARRARQAAGRPDKIYALRQRVVGFT